MSERFRPTHACQNRGMNTPADSLEHELERSVQRRLQRLSVCGVDVEIVDAQALHKLALASDFAIDTLCQQPALLAGIAAEIEPAPALDSGLEAEWPRLLRRWRRAQSTRLIWRDLQAIDSVEATLAGSSEIADRALQAALRALSGQMQARHGVVHDAQGRIQELVVFGLGKLGGRELNFSSDVDLVYAFAEHGVSDGARSLDAETYFARLGQQLAKLLGEVTPDGFSHRVDLRLRPFGNSGRVALSFAAMEQYYQREGRDWERYAWIKARPVAGDLAAGGELLDGLRPFVYRRYLDYTALDGLREMKALVDAEVQRRELADDLKLGPGGIREIEFFVQAQQLIRGGREPALRQSALLPALAALTDAGHLPQALSAQLASAYRFLRRLENRVQMLADAQTHSLPADPLLRLRIARGLDYSDSAALEHELDAHRRIVSEAFAGLLQSRRRKPVASALTQYWRALPESADYSALSEAGFADASAQHARLRDFSRSPALRGLSERARSRLDHVLPSLLEAAAHSTAPDQALARGTSLLQAIVRRSSYLALLEERPAALTRLVDVVARSALLAERLVAHPLLLDELLDVRASPSLDIDAAVRAAAELHAQHGLAADTEERLAALNEARQSLSFRIALATLAQRQPAQATARQLAILAESLLDECLRLAQDEIRAAHGVIVGSGFAVIGYGSLGARELGFGSDLDLVFLHNARVDQVSDGVRPLDASRYYARLAQKLVSLMATVTPAGRLYEVDMRLRPDGAKGLLVSTLDSFAEYQQQRAWTWELQALARSRAVAGDERVRAAFVDIRDNALRRTRDPDALRHQVTTMRLRMRAELDRSNALNFDLKQGEAGLVDLEFLLQAQLLLRAAEHPALSELTETVALIPALAEAGAWTTEQARALLEAHGILLAKSLDCTLDQRPRLSADDAALQSARSAIRERCLALGLDFTSG
jgi:glutamate-ammonia-ligase adenylyltransferase